MKIGCFGMSCAVDSALSQHVMHRTTTLFSAPEWSRGIACLKSDVWSLGMSVIEMAEGKHPLASCTSFQVMKKVCDGEPPSLSSSEWSSDLVEFVKRCLVKDVNRRSSVEELLRVGVSSVSLDIASLRARRRGANRERRQLLFVV